jgi:putative flippase GtrA
LFELTIGRAFGYMASLYLSYLLAIGFAFILHRRYTFRISGFSGVSSDLARFSSVYLVALGTNTVALPVLVELAGMSSLLAQAVVVVVTTTISYFGHKFFSFRRPKRPTPRADGN